MDMAVQVVGKPSLGAQERRRYAGRAVLPSASVLRLCVAAVEAQTGRSLERLCHELGGVEIVAATGSDQGALDALKGLPIDVLLLEAEGSGRGAIERMRAVGGSGGPASIVISSRPELAAAAFEADAVDFLEKPLSAPRLQQALAKARRRLRIMHADEGGLLGSAPASAQAAGMPRALVGERDRKFYLLGPSEIDYIQSARNYVLIHARGVPYIRRTTLKELAEALRRGGYSRISRSLLVNLAAVHYVERQEGGTFAFTMRDGMTLESTSAFRAEVIDVLHGMGHSWANESG
jgi:DNA-binding LytR/AlgR family response regulator